MELETLQQQLLYLNIDLSQWSHDLGTKTVADLYDEIRMGEAKLEIIDRKLVRVVKLVSIEVQIKLGDKLFILVEDKQIFLTGAVRKRGFRSIAEKITGDETPEQTVTRALEEEIGLKTDKTTIFIEQSEKLKGSPSYPQLDSLYKTWKYKLMLDQEDLEKIKFSEYQQDKEKITLFSLEEMESTIH